MFREERDCFRFVVDSRWPEGFPRSPDLRGAIASAFRALLEERQRLRGQAASLGAGIEEAG